MEILTAGAPGQYRSVLERGDILFFPGGGFDIPVGARTALMGATQNARSFHKNIAYKTNVDRVSGLEDRAEAARVAPAMREYSRAALNFMAAILPDYSREWKVDYASFRSIEERGRALPLTKRNDLLHVDAFPTRPVFGNLILRCFTNVSPDQPREWMTSDPFAKLAQERALSAGLGRFAAAADSPLHGGKRAALRSLRKLGLPVVDRSPYDAFMLHFHDWLKANREYQENSPKYRFDLPPASTWLVFTDIVPHAVLGGRLAFEQTVIVARGVWKTRGARHPRFSRKWPARSSRGSEAG
ncbi:MAG: Kdo hydroxylase family protein [Acidobacteriota bacterium]|nr:Kdo hydroxylase family protein [Acidobacteriota bacterium]